MLLAGLLLSGCFSFENTYTKIPPGPYRAVLKLDVNPVSLNPKGEPLPDKLNLEFEEVTAGELPFNFEVTYTDDTTFHIDIINGTERIRVPAEHITFGRSPGLARDTFRIDFPVYDSYITGYYEENILEGFWVVNYRDQYRIPFVARHGQDYRFTQLRKAPVMDVSGEWEVTFGDEDEEPYKALAEFEQQGNDLRGTFRTETGDYRFLEGTVQADKLYLSVFDGSHAYLFEAKIRPDGTLTGSYRSGQHYRTVWEARRNPDFKLADPDSLTALKPGIGQLRFAFPTADGDTISLDDERFAGKVKLIQIMGTWCPNCRDESVFLQEYLAANPSEDLAVIALAFERYRDTARAREALRRYQREMNIDYPVLLAGYYDKADASAALPALSRIISYPTLLFVDRDNRVRLIHTGFNGPATSRYPAFKEHFEQTVSQLLAEKSNATATNER